jgi:hypothetical protein
MTVHPPREFPAARRDLVLLQSQRAVEVPVPVRETRLRRILALTMLTCAALAAIFWLGRTPPHRAMAAQPVPSIAVLPLDNLSGDPSQEYFVDGMTDELITDLAKIGALR